jgi:hypothetical protein
MPWGTRLVVGMRGRLGQVRVSKTLTLWAFLLVTSTQRPSGDGSTL